jgi:hypothetical protein
MIAVQSPPLLPLLFSLLPELLLSPPSFIPPFMPHPLSLPLSLHLSYVPLCPFHPTYLYSLPHSHRSVGTNCAAAALWSG